MNKGNEKKKEVTVHVVSLDTKLPMRPYHYIWLLCLHMQKDLFFSKILRLLCKGFTGKCLVVQDNYMKDFLLGK